MSSVDRLNPQFILRNAHRHMRRMNKYRGMPLWSLIGDLTSHGSTISMDICRQMGWDPHANVNSDLPHAQYARERPAQETRTLPPREEIGGWRCECGEWMPPEHENCTECLKDRPSLNR